MMTCSVVECLLVLIRPLTSCFDFFVPDDRKESSSSPSFVREGLRTSVASAASGESFSSVSAADTNDENELATPASKSRSSSLSALGVSRLLRDIFSHSSHFPFSLLSRSAAIRWPAFIRPPARRATER